MGPISETPQEGGEGVGMCVGTGLEEVWEVCWDVGVGKKRCGKMWGEVQESVWGSAFECGGEGNVWPEPPVKVSSAQSIEIIKTLLQTLKSSNTSTLKWRHLHFEVAPLVP